MLAFFQSMVATDEASRATALETLKAAADRGNAHARLALQSAQRGQVLVTAILEARKLKEADAYTAWVQGGEKSVPENAPVAVAPIPTKVVQPSYPQELMAERLGGSAVVAFVVNADGSVDSVQVVEATHPSFGIAAEEAVKKWSFTPASKNGKPLPARMRVPFAFKPPQ